MPRSPGSLTNRQAIAVVSTSPRCFTLASSHRRHSSKPGKSLAPSSDVVSHQEATARLSNPPQSAASQVVPWCRCRERCHPTKSHTALTIAKQRQPPRSAASSQPTTKQQPLAATKTSIAAARARQHPSSLPCGGIIDTGSSPHGQWAGNATNRAGSLETTPPRRARRRKRRRRSSRIWTGFSPREPRAAELELQNDALNRENDVQGRRRHPTGKNAGKGFPPEHSIPMLHVHGATFGHHSHGNPSGATPPPRLHAPCRRSSTFASSTPPALWRRQHRHTHASADLRALALIAARAHAALASTSPRAPAPPAARDSAGPHAAPHLRTSAWSPKPPRRARQLGEEKVPAAAFLALRWASSIELRRRQVWETVGEGLAATGSCAARATQGERRVGR